MSTGIDDDKGVQSMADADELMLLPEAAVMARKPEATMRWLRHTGEGPKSGKLGRRVVCRRSDVQAWIGAGFDCDNEPASA